ncbi:MAG: hypothetical protein HY709_06225 [Candidatus Latescibacteria bacterium]|nr:hypothetical protein [Candidatus Latescibacterota bacterium]
MRRSILLTVSLVFCVWGIVSGHTGIEQFAPQYPPQGPGISVDGNLDDWGGFPEGATITIDEMFARAGDDKGLDPPDFDVTIMTCWNDANNYFYLGIESFDDIYNANPTQGLPDVYLYDAMEMAVDADHSGGTYQYGSLPQDQWGQTGQQWMFSPTPSPYSLVLRSSGATWMNVEPYNNYWAIVKTEATGTRIFQESYMVLWDFLSPVGPEQSIPHDLKEGDTIGLTFQFNDYDENPSAHSAMWHVQVGGGVDENADLLPDWHIIGSQGWDLSKLPTAVNSNSWGAIKATFAR